MDKIIIYLRSGQTIEDTLEDEECIDGMIEAIGKKEMIQGLAHTWVWGSDIAAIYWPE